MAGSVAPALRFVPLPEADRVALGYLRRAREDPYLALAAAVLDALEDLRVAEERVAAAERGVSAGYVRRVPPQ